MRRNDEKILPNWARTPALFGVKSAHSFAFFVIQSAICYLLYSGLRSQTDRRAAIAAAIATGETLIYAGNGFRCPLTGLAEDLGAERGSVTDIFLPRWLAANIARIYGPLFALGLVLHARNVARAWSDHPQGVGGRA
jgi:hypothetical protein